MSFDRITKHQTQAALHSLFPLEGRALDACCGLRREWSRDRPTSTRFADKEISVRPELVHDFKALPFKDGVFDRIYWDPPRAEWEAALDAVNVEFRRVARDGCILHVKIITGTDRRVTKMADLEKADTLGALEPAAATEQGGVV